MVKIETVNDTKSTFLLSESEEAFYIKKKQNTRMTSVLLKLKYLLELFGNINNNINENCLKTWIAL